MLHMQGVASESKGVSGVEAGSTACDNRSRGLMRDRRMRIASQMQLHDSGMLSGLFALMLQDSTSSCDARDAIVYMYDVTSCSLQTWKARHLDTEASLG